jgi:hypothetical protein
LLWFWMWGKKAYEYDMITAYVFLSARNHSLVVGSAFILYPCVCCDWKLKNRRYALWLCEESMC